MRHHGPSPWHTVTKRDDRLWDEEVVEILIDPDGDGRNYAEIEFNPINVVCDLVLAALNARELTPERASRSKRVTPSFVSSVGPAASPANSHAVH